LRAATRYLKERAPIAGFELTGTVIRLQSAAPMAGGEVSIAGLVDGGIRQVLVSLGGDDYQRAMHAHHQELEVSVEGELVREGRSYRLGNPRMFAVVEIAAERRVSLPGGPMAIASSRHGGTHSVGARWVPSRVCG
jgi:hypothetical protein